MVKSNIKKQAFTLIELMAVVIILGIITTITVTSINYSIKESKNRLYIQQVSRLEAGVRKWAVENTDKIPTDETGITFFSINRLKDEGIVDTEIVTDPRTNTELNGCMTIKYDLVNQQYDYKYEEETCSLVESFYEPIITVVGGDLQYAEVNGFYEFPLASSVDYNGRQLEVEGPIIYKGTNVMTTLDLALVGDEYRLVYESYDDQLNLRTEKEIILLVRDTVSPIIRLGATGTVVHESGDTFIFPTLDVSDNSCGLTGIDTSVNSCNLTLNPSVSATGFNNIIPGTYPIYYTATDSSGNIKVAVLNVAVQDTVEPTITSVTGNPTSWTNNNVTLVINASDAGSGLHSTAYSFDGGTTWQASNTAVFTTNQIVNIKVRDAALNTQTTSLTIDINRIDKELPNVSLGVWDPTESPWKTSGTQTFNYSGYTDAVSGINSTLTQTSCTTANTHGSTCSVNIVDNAGNIVVVTSPINRVDTTLPTSQTISYTNGYIATTTQTITFSAADAESGISSYTLYRRSATLTNDVCGTYSSWSNLGVQSSGYISTVADGNCYQYYVVATNGAGATASTSTSPTATTKVDITLPSTPTISYTNGYVTTTSQAITFSATDAESGISSYTLYRRSATLTNNVCGTYGAWASLGTQASGYSATVAGGNCYQYYVVATNGAGATSSSTTSPTLTTKVDTTLPTCGTTWDPTISPWKASGGQSFTLSGSTDTGGSGINAAGGTCTTGTANGNTCTVTISDNAGLTRACTSPANRVDTTAPSTPTISYTNGYVTTTSQSITFSATDAESGISSYTLYRRSATLTNNVCGTYGAWASLGTQASGYSATVAGGNCYQYYVVATNGAGATSSSTTSPTLTTKVDTTLPTCGTTWDPTISPWKASGGQSFTLSGSTDTGGSGINAAGGTCTTGTANGNTCTVTISDNAGLTRACTSPANRVDTTAPSTPTLTVSESWTNAASVAGTIGGSTDAESGVASYQYSMSGATTLGWTTGTSFTVTNAGSTVVTVRAINGAGTASTTTAKTVNIDRTAPSLTFSRNGSTTYSLSQCTTPSYSDAGGSGINTGSALYVWSSATSGVTPSYSMPSGSSRCYSSTTTTIRLHGRVCDNAGNCTQLYTGEGISGAPQVFYVDVEAPTWRSTASPSNPTCVIQDFNQPCSLKTRYTFSDMINWVSDSRSGNSGGSARVVFTHNGGSRISSNTGYHQYNSTNTSYVYSYTLTSARDNLGNELTSSTSRTFTCSKGTNISVCPS
jgi:prepilin-type N-terminal cleavage/methylation domain-containing protein